MISCHCNGAEQGPGPQYPRKFVCILNLNKQENIIHVLSAKIANTTAIYATLADLPMGSPAVPVTKLSTLKYARTFSRRNAKN